MHTHLLVLTVPDPSPEKLELCCGMSCTAHHYLFILHYTTAHSFFVGTHRTHFTHVALL